MIDVVMIELLRTTGAARRFLADRVEPAVVHQILDDARFAPSGGNRQPWKRGRGRGPGAAPADRRR